MDAVAGDQEWLRLNLSVMSGNLIRTFIALEVPEEVKKQIRLAQEHLHKVGSARVAWVKPNGIHLTLAFLGDVEENNLPDLIRLVGDCSASHRPFSLIITATGAFPGFNNPRVLWLGVEGGFSLVQLQSDVEMNLVRSGFMKPEKRFHPHLTLGRVKSFDRGSLLSSQTRSYVFKEVRWEAVEVRVMSSELKPSGAEYAVLAALVLGQK